MAVFRYSTERGSSPQSAQVFTAFRSATALFAKPRIRTGLPARHRPIAADWSLASWRTACWRKASRYDVLVRLPDSISFEHGASLPCAGLSAWSSLAGGPSGYAVPPGGTIHGTGTGGVSLFAVQFAKAMGCKVIAHLYPERMDRLKALGARSCH